MSPGAKPACGPSRRGSATIPGGYTTLATILPDFLGGGMTVGTDGTPVRQAIAAYEAGSMTGAG